PIDSRREASSAAGSCATSNSPRARSRHSLRTSMRSRPMIALKVRPLLIAIANSRQYGNGALIAPGALLDDGKLDLVVVNDMPAWRVLMHAPKMFAGTVARVRGV